MPGAPPLRSIRSSAYDWLIFTSANGVKFFFARLFEKGTDIRRLAGLKICTIGRKTDSAAVNAFGVMVDLVPDEFNAEGLIEAFINKVGIQNAEARNREAGLLIGMRFLLPRAESAREVFPEKVRALSGTIDVPAAYRAGKPELHGKRLKRFLKEGRVTIATFTSAATYTNFRDIMGDDADDLLKNGHKHTPIYTPSTILTSVTQFLPSLSQQTKSLWVAIKACPPYCLTTLQ